MIRLVGRGSDAHAKCGKGQNRAEPTLVLAFLTSWAQKHLIIELFLLYSYSTH
jgi:hypothetical protein